MVLKVIKRALLALVIFVGIFAAWLSDESDVRSRGTPRKVFVEIERGKGVRPIARLLKEKGIIPKKGPFLLEYQLFFFPRGLKAGEYQFSAPLKITEVLHELIEGRVFLHPLTVPEGLTADEIATIPALLNFGREEDFLGAFGETEDLATWDPKARNLEGYLYPETYHFAKGTTAREIARTMVAQFQYVFGKPWLARANEMGLLPRDVVTLASLIEKETSLPEEKKLVSAVFHNRLRLGMKLDCDPTIIYALKQKKSYQGRLTYKDLKLESPYNTYLHPGLPPGPICNPGKDSLEAALYPAKEDYLYFVSRNDGSHAFSRSFTEHQNAVRKFQKNTRRK
jgi:UPF0755 protein